MLTTNALSIQGVLSRPPSSKKINLKLDLFQNKLKFDLFLNHGDDVNFTIKRRDLDFGRIIDFLRMRLGN